MSVLPSGFIRVEYLESSGTQYIDTGFKPNQDTRVVFDFEQRLNTTSALTAFGARVALYDSAFYFLSMGNSGTNVQDAYGDGLATAVPASEVGVRGIVDKNKNTTNYRGDILTNSAGSFTCPYNLYLFCNNNAGTASQHNTIRVYACQIYDNGTMVRDYYPAVRVSDGVAGLYDTINDVFYTNAGTGTFAVGKYVVDSDEILPLEYIESTGTQYLDTEFYPKYNSRVVVDVSGLPAGSNMVFGTRNKPSSTASKGFVFYRSSATAIRSDYFGTTVSAALSDATGRTIIDKNRNVTTAFGLTLTNTSVSSGESSYPLFIFATNDQGSAITKSKMKLYSSRIYDDETLVRNYVPAKIPATDDVGLWDRLSGAFYVDAAGGAFVAGPIVVEDEAEIVKVEYIESSGTQYIDTRFVPNQDTRAVLSAYNLSSSSVWTFGCWTAKGSKQFAFCCLNTYSFRYGTDGVQLTTLPVGPVSAELNKNVYTLNGTTGTLSAQTFTCDYSMYLFRINAAGAASSGKFIGRAYSFQIYDNGTIARDYIPAIFRSVVGLYDKENGIFYDNAGTGVFIAGPEIQETAEVPTGVHLTERTENSVSFAWDDMGSDAYRVYRNGDLLATVSVTNYTDSGLQSGDLNTYAVSSVSGELESAAAQLGYVQTVLPGVSGLITDRTLSDVNAVKNTAAAILSGTATAEQITEFSRWMKGAYSDIDLNRVEDAVAFIVQTLNGFEDDLREYLAQQDVQEDPIFFPAWVTQKIELVTFVLWQESDYPVTEDMVRYLSNVSTIRAALPGISAPALPGSMAGLGYTSANAIEAVLVAAMARFQTLTAEQYGLADRAVLSFVGCGEFGCGEV